MTCLNIIYKIIKNDPFIKSIQREFGMYKEKSKKPLSLKEYQEEQKKEILGPDNEWFTGEKLGHSPTDEEAAQHYVEHGGPESFAQKYLLKNRIETSEESEKEETKKENDKT